MKEQEFANLVAEKFLTRYENSQFNTEVDRQFLIKMVKRSNIEKHHLRLENLFGQV